MAGPIELKPGERILIGYFEHLTELILAIPLIETLKKRYPENRFEVLTSEGFTALCKNIKHLDNVVTLDSTRLRNDEDYRDEILNKINEQYYQVAIVIYPNKEVGRLLYEAGILYRIGSGKRFHSIYFDRHIFHNREDNRKHESEYNLDYLKFFRQGVLFKIPKLDIYNRELDEARRLLTLDGISGEFIILHPIGADADTGAGDRWPLDQFIELADLFNKKDRLVLMTGTAEEGTLINQAASNYGIRVHTYAGKTDLLVLAALFSMARAVVTNAGGPLHLAAAVGTKAIGIYPSEQQLSSVRWQPLGEDNHFIQPYPDSSIETINVEEVARVVLNSMNKVKAE